MASDNRNITIILKNESNDTNSSASSLSVSSKTSTSSSQAESNNNSSIIATCAYMAVQAGEAVANELISWGDYKIDKYMNLHDDYIGQRNMNVAQHYINGAVSTGSTIASMTATGAAMGGWIGAIIGAVVGTGVAISRISRSNVQGNDQQEIVLKQLDLQLQYTRRRAGWSLQAASIGEDL